MKDSKALLAILWIKLNFPQIPIDFLKIYYPQICGYNIFLFLMPILYCFIFTRAWNALLDAKKGMVLF